MDHQQPRQSGTFDVSGFLGGATVGVNVQADAFVFGVDGDFDASWITSGSSINILCIAACETKNTWLATIRGRVGYAADRVLFYGTAGGAFGNIEAGVTPFSCFSNTIEPGWTAGPASRPPSARTGRPGSSTFSSTWKIRPARRPIVAIPLSDTIKFDASIVRLGLDYKFR